MGTCSNHPRLVPGFDSIDEVVSTVYVFNKRLTVDFLTELASDYMRQSKNDRAAGRVILVNSLKETSYHLSSAVDDLTKSCYLSKYDSDSIPFFIFSLNKLAFDIGNLQYDVAVEFITKYSFLLPPAFNDLYAARNSLQKAWNISEPFMK